MDDLKLAGKKQNLYPMWKLVNKEVDLGEPTSFLDHAYLGCTQRQCEISQNTVDNYRTMVRIANFRGEIREITILLKIFVFLHGLMTWLDHAKKCEERNCELANKTTQQLCKVFTPCTDDLHLKEEEMQSVGELSHVCSQIVLKCLHLTRIGRPDILWSVNKLARSITKMDRILWQTPESIDLIYSSHM